MQDRESELLRIPLPRTWLNKAVAFCILARVPATSPLQTQGGAARRSKQGACWWDATRPPPPPAGVPRYAGRLRGIARALERPSRPHQPLIGHLKELGSYRGVAKQPLLKLQQSEV